MPQDVVNHPARPGTRRYESPKRTARALATRRRIRAAAEALFLRDGYARTTMTAVADAAGVAEKTVYLAFPSKAALLDEVVVAAVRDDEGEEPLRGRLLATLCAPPEQLLTRFGELHAAVMGRTARVIALAESAATLDRELTGLRERAHASLRTTFRALAVALDRNDLLAEGTSVDDAADTIYALANESVYLRLIDGCAWPHERYAEWLTRVLAGVLSR